MSDPAIATIAAAIVILLGALIFSRSGVSRNPKDRFKTSKQVIAHANILYGFGKKQAAITTLETGASIFPKSTDIKAKLEQFKGDA